MGFTSSALKHLKELLGLIATHYYRKNDMVSAAIYAIALRQLSPEGYSQPVDVLDLTDPHDQNLQNELNKRFGMDNYQFAACDMLLNMVKKELSLHGIIDSPTPARKKQK